VIQKHQEWVLHIYDISRLGVNKLLKLGYEVLLKFIYTYVYDLFNDAFNNSHQITSNVRTIHEKGIGKVV